MDDVGVVFGVEVGFGFGEGCVDFGHVFGGIDFLEHFSTHVGNEVGVVKVPGRLALGIGCFPGFGFRCFPLLHQGEAFDFQLVLGLFEVQGLLTLRFLVLVALVIERDLHHAVDLLAVFEFGIGIGGAFIDQVFQGGEIIVHDGAQRGGSVVRGRTGMVGIGCRTGMAGGGAYLIRPAATFSPGRRRAAERQLRPTIGRTGLSLGWGWRVGLALFTAFPEGGEVAAMDFDALGPEPVEDFAGGSVLVPHAGQVFDVRFHEVQLGAQVQVVFFHPWRL